MSKKNEGSRQEIGKLSKIDKLPPGFEIILSNGKAIGTVKAVKPQLNAEEYILDLRRNVYNSALCLDDKEFGNFMSNLEALKGMVPDKKLEGGRVNQKDELDQRIKEFRDMRKDHKVEYDQKYPVGSKKRNNIRDIVYAMVIGDLNTALEEFAGYKEVNMKDVQQRKAEAAAPAAKKVANDMGAAKKKQSYLSKKFSSLKKGLSMVREKMRGKVKSESKEVNLSDNNSVGNQQLETSSRSSSLTSSDSAKSVISKAAKIGQEVAKKKKRRKVKRKSNRKTNLKQKSKLGR